jgi:hypothetical protein
VVGGDVVGLDFEPAADGGGFDDSDPLGVAGCGGDFDPWSGLGGEIDFAGRLTSPPLRGGSRSLAGAERVGRVGRVGPLRGRGRGGGRGRGLGGGLGPAEGGPRAGRRGAWRWVRSMASGGGAGACRDEAAAM